MKTHSVLIVSERRCDRIPLFWLNWHFKKRVSFVEVIGNYSSVKLFRTNTRRFLLYVQIVCFPPVVVVIIASLGVFLIAGPIFRPVTQLHCETVFCRSSGAALAWHSHCITSHPTQSTRCQLRPGLMNKFMRCTGFVGSVWTPSRGALNTN